MILLQASSKSWSGLWTMDYGLILTRIYFFQKIALLFFKCRYNFLTIRSCFSFQSPLHYGVWRSIMSLVLFKLVNETLALFSGTQMDSPLGHSNQQCPKWGTTRCTLDSRGIFFEAGAPNEPFFSNFIEIYHGHKISQKLAFSEQFFHLLENFYVIRTPSKNRPEIPFVRRADARGTLTANSPHNKSTFLPGEEGRGRGGGGGEQIENNLTALWQLNLFSSNFPILLSPARRHTPAEHLRRVPLSRCNFLRVSSEALSKYSSWVSAWAVLRRVETLASRVAPVKSPNVKETLFRKRKVFVDWVELVNWPPCKEIWKLTFRVLALRQN